MSFLKTEPVPGPELCLPDVSRSLAHTLRDLGRRWNVNSPAGGDGMLTLRTKREQEMEKTLETT